jgi:hypothetical protein
MNPQTDELEIFGASQAEHKTIMDLIKICLDRVASTAPNTPSKFREAFTSKLHQLSDHSKSQGVLWSDFSGVIHQMCSYSGTLSIEQFELLALGLYIDCRRYITFEDLAGPLIEFAEKFLEPDRPVERLLNVVKEFMYDYPHDRRRV